MDSQSANFGKVKLNSHNLAGIILHHSVQGASGGREPGLGWLRLWSFHYLPSLHGQDESLAELAVQLGKIMEHPYQSEPNPGP